MSWWLWIVAVALGGCLFGLGMLTSWVLRTRADIRRPQLLLGVFFTVIALMVAADTVQLQVRFHEHVDEQMTAEQGQLECNQRQTDALVVTGRARRDVDVAALAYDRALQAFLAAPLSEREPGDPAVVNLSTALDVLVAARRLSAQTYTDHPLPDC